MQEKIVQVSGFGVKNTEKTQSEFMIVAVTNQGKVLLTNGADKWRDISPILRPANKP